MFSMMSPRVKLQKSCLLDAVDTIDETEEDVDGLVGVLPGCSGDGVAVRDKEAFQVPDMPGLAGKALFRLRFDRGKSVSSSKAPSRPQDCV